MKSESPLCISVLGLGYVGTVTMACLCRNGHRVIGCDVQPGKVESINAGHSPITEPGVEELLQQGAAEGRVSATTQLAEAVHQADLVIVCVGTPSQLSGDIDLRFVQRVFSELPAALPPHAAVVLRSTVLPGSTRTLSRELAETTELFFVPEFLREGSAVADFDAPALEAIGTRDGAPPRSRGIHQLVGESTPVLVWEEAELLKYACNAFHATKVVFANEIGRLAKRAGVDGRQVMQLVCADTKLNISPYYLRPGNPYGGSCLPKDVRALGRLAAREGMEVPLLSSLEPSNRSHLEELLALIEQTGQKRVAILGLSFKAQTDDLRHSSMVTVAQYLLGHGYELSIFDPNLNLASIHGSNRRAIDAQLPHLGKHLTDSLEAAVSPPCTVVLAHPIDAERLRPLVGPQHTIIDVNGHEGLSELPSAYHGFCW